MAKKQIIVCFDNGRWLCDFITIENGEIQKDILDAYMAQYEKASNSMEIVSKLLGHSSMKITQDSYGMIVQKKISLEMSKLNE